MVSRMVGGEPIRLPLQLRRSRAVKLGNSGIRSTCAVLQMGGPAFEVVVVRRSSWLRRGRRTERDLALRSFPLGAKDGDRQERRKPGGEESAEYKALHSEGKEIDQA